MMSILPVPLGFPDDRERLAPIPLPRKKPVAQFVVDRAFAEAAFFQPLGDLANRFARWKTVNDWRVDRDAVADKPNRFFSGRWLNNLANWQIKFARKFEIALVVRRHGHDRAGAISEQNVIGDPDRNFLVVDRIDRERAGEDASLLFCQLSAFEIAFARSLRSIFANGRPLLFGHDKIDN